MWQYLDRLVQLVRTEGIWARILQHIWYTFAALGLAAAIALPVGLRIGHTRRGAFLAINLGNAARALPSLGLLMLAVLLTDQIGFLPVLIALVALGIPPILASTYAGSVRCRSGHDRRGPGDGDDRAGDPDQGGDPDRAAADHLRSARRHPADRLDRDDRRARRRSAASAATWSTG